MSVPVSSAAIRNKDSNDHLVPTFADFVECDP